MKKSLLSIIIAFSFLQIGYCQTTEELNLDFEQVKKGYPVHWESMGNADYKVYSDSITTKNGRYSVVIENNSKRSNFKSLSIDLPENYEGKEIRLTGFIKTENVTEGYAGLWVRIDPEVGFDNMNDRGATGTTDWKKYEIVLPLDPKKTERIIVGGLLVGKGKMWLDDLSVSIDGKDLDSENLKPHTPRLLPADEDKEFDKGAKIIFPDLTRKTVKNLELLGRIWGFLKYYHPEIAAGNYNWDYELFRVLPDYLKARNNRERDSVLSSWIDNCGKLEACEKCETTPENAVLKPDLFWIEDSNLSGSVKGSLNAIYKNRNQEENYYVRLLSNVGNPDFRNENPYEDMPYPDEGFRLLALYRYWNIIEYFYPNKNLTDKDWDDVLKEYIPRFVQANNELEYELTVLQLIGEVRDTHANLWGGGNQLAKLRGNNFAPFRAEFVENKLVVTDYYNPKLLDTTQLKIGDIITHIKDRSIQSITDSLKPYYPASNKAARLRDMARDLMRSPQKKLRIKYHSGASNKEQEISLYPKEDLDMYGFFKMDEDEKSYKMLDDNIGYITLASIQEKDIEEIKELFKDTKGIIIDIRNYPYTYVPFTLGSYFVSQPTAFVKFTLGNVKNPGEFMFTDPIKIPNDEIPYKGKLAVLVNEYSQSQAEYTAMAFRAGDNTTIFGSTTAGADGDVSIIHLPGGLQTMISGIGIYYPNGQKTQRIGIVPDIKVKPTIEGIKNGRDEVLEKAIEFIKQ